MAITINGSGSITGLSTGGLPDGSVDADTLATDSVTAAKLKSDAIAAGDLPAGSVLQVVQAEETDVLSFTISSQGQWNDVLSQSITPVAANSNILVMWYTSVSTNSFGQRGTMRVLRGSTAIGIGDASSNRLRGSHGSMLVTDYVSQCIALNQTYMDDPTYTLGNSITYKLQASWESSASPMYINRSASDTDNNTYHRGSTFMQLLEVAA